MITVGIIGCGFVGTALKVWLEENNLNVEIRVSDPPKGMNAFAKLTQGTALGTLLAPLHQLNVHFRGTEERV